MSCPCLFGAALTSRCPHMVADGATRPHFIARPPKQVRRSVWRRRGRPPSDIIAHARPWKTTPTAAVPATGAVRRQTTRRPSRAANVARRPTIARPCVRRVTGRTAITRPASRRSQLLQSQRARKSDSDFIELKSHFSIMDQSIRCPLTHQMIPPSSPYYEACMQMRAIRHLTTFGQVSSNLREKARL